MQTTEAVHGEVGKHVLSAYVVGELENVEVEVVRQLKKVLLVLGFLQEGGERVLGVLRGRASFEVAGGARLVALHDSLVDILHVDC